MALIDLLGPIGRLWGQRHRDTHFRAIVTDTAGNTIQIRRVEQANPDEQYYAAHEGIAAAVSPGDEVTVVDFTGEGGYIVTGHVTR